MEKKCKNCINHNDMHYRQILCRRTNEIQFTETLIKTIIKPKER